MNEQYLAFLIFVLVATATPGGATTLATASGMRYGVWKSIPYILGAASGLGILSVASAFGLAALLMAVPALELTVRALGTAYLLYLAWRVATAGSPSQASQAARPISLWGAAWLVWYNPKAWAITIGACSSFAHLVANPTRQALLMGVTFLICAAASLAMWCTTGQLLASILKTDRQWRALNILMGVLLSASIVPMWVGAA